MPTKNQPKKWTEVEFAITALTVAGTLGLWNLFATPSTTQNTAQDITTTNPSLNPASDSAQNSLVSLPLHPVKIIYGGQAPTGQVIQVVATQVPSNAVKVSANPVHSRPASTGSSKP